MDLQKVIAKHDAEALHQLIADGISLNETLPNGFYPFEYAVMKAAVPLIGIFATNDATRKTRYFEFKNCDCDPEKIYLGVLPFDCGCAMISQSDCLHGFKSAHNMYTSVYLELARYNCHYPNTKEPHSPCPMLPHYGKTYMEGIRAKCDDDDKWCAKYEAKIKANEGIKLVGIKSAMKR